MKAENVKLGIAPIGWTNDDMAKKIPLNNVLVKWRWPVLLDVKSEINIRVM